MRELTWKKWTCWMLCIFLLGLPSCGGGGNDNTSSGTTQTTQTPTTNSSNLIIQITFSEEMDTSIPAGIAVAKYFPDLFGPKAAHAGTFCCQDCLGINALAVIVSIIWLTTTILQIEVAGINPGNFLLTLNGSGCSEGFRTADGFVLATYVLAVAFVLGQIVKLAVKVR